LNEEEALALFEKAIKRFEQQFNVTLEPTGYDHSYEENDGIGEIEYWVKNLIESKTNALLIEVGGWFSHDTRNDQNNIYCSLAIKINGESVNPDKALQSWYDVENDRWEELIYDTY
jgi:hypothetical protein